jgi:hypothetical protein
MSDRFLEQRINIKFCVKLGKNASSTCAMLSETCEGQAMRKSSVSGRQKRFKEGGVSKSQMKELIITFFEIKRVLFTSNSVHKAKQ